MGVKILENRKKMLFFVGGDFNGVVGILDYSEVYLTIITLLSSEIVTDTLFEFQIIFLIISF